jgi:uncharacterized lipoprotein YajG
VSVIKQELASWAWQIFGKNNNNNVWLRISKRYPDLERQDMEITMRKRSSLTLLKEQVEGGGGIYTIRYKGSQKGHNMMENKRLEINWSWEE